MAQAGRLVKETLVQEITARLTERPNFVVTTVNRLSAPEADDLRRKLSVSQAQFLLVKRSLGLLAIKSLKISNIDALLAGQVGLVLPGDDVAQTLKAIVDFIKTHEEKLGVRGAWVDGQVMDKKTVEQLAALPPRPVLLAQVVGTLEAPIADVIFTLERLIGDIAWIAEQASEKKPTAAPVAPQAAGAPPAGGAAAVETPKAETPKAPQAAAPEQKPTTPQEGTGS